MERQATPATHPAEGFWTGLPAGRVAVWLGGRTPDAPAEWRCLKVRCVSGMRPLGPVRDALAQAESLLGDRLPVADLAAWRVRQGVRRRLLGEEAADEPGVALLVAITRLARELPAEPLALVFDGVEHADADTIRWLQERVARPGGAASLVIAVGTEAELVPGGPVARLVEAAVEAGGRVGRDGAAVDAPRGGDAPAPAAAPVPLSAEALPAELRLVLRAGAVVGEVFDTTLVARLLDRPPLRVLEQIQDAVDRGLPVVDLGGGQVRLGAQIAAALRAEVTPSLGEAWRRALVELIDPTVQASGQPVPTAEVADVVAGMREEAAEGEALGLSAPETTLTEPAAPATTGFPEPFEPIRPGAPSEPAWTERPQAVVLDWAAGGPEVAPSAGALPDAEDEPVPDLDDLVPASPAVPVAAEAAAPVPAEAAAPADPPQVAPPAAAQVAPPADPPQAEPPAAMPTPEPRRLSGRWRLRNDPNPMAERRPERRPPEPTPESALSAADHLSAIGEAEAAAVRLLEAAARAEAVGAMDQASGAARRALALLDQLPRTPERRRLRADGLLRLAGLAWGNGGRVPLAESLRIAERALAELGDDPGDGRRARARATIAGIAYDIGDAPSLERALTELTEAIHELSAAGDARGAARLLNDQAAVWVRIGDVVRAAHLLEESRRIFSGIGAPGPLDQAELAETLHLLARLPLTVGARPGQEQNALERAVQHAGEADAIYARLGQVRERARVWETLGSLSARRGKRDAARTWLSRAFEAQLQLGDAVGLAQTTEALAVQLAGAGQLGQALQVLVDSVALNQQLGSPRGLVHNRESLGKIAQLPLVAAEPRALAALRAVEERIAAAEAAWAPQARA